MDTLPEYFHNKDELLEKIIEERKLLFNFLDRIVKNEGIHYAEKPILHDDWSIKDTIAHVVEWELAMIRCLDTSLRSETPEQIPYGLPDEDVEQINAEYYRQNLNKPVGQVYDGFQDAYYVIIGMMRRVTESDLFDPGRFGWLAGKPFWPIVAANTCWHYVEHRKLFENQNGPESGIRLQL